jgi:P-type Cu+ transporter
MGLFGSKKTISVEDPVCGMKVDPSKAAGTESHDGTTFHFCSQACVTAFRKDPHKYGHAH